METEAFTSLEIWVNCPHCTKYQNRFEELREHLDHNELHSYCCDVELTCESDICNKKFTVTKINY